MLPQLAPSLPNLDALRTMRPIGTPERPIDFRLPQPGGGAPGGPPQWGGGPPRPIGPYPVPPIRVMPPQPVGPEPGGGPYPVGPYPVGPGVPMRPVATPEPRLPIGTDPNLPVGTPERPIDGGPPQYPGAPQTMLPQPGGGGGGLDNLRALLQMYPQLAARFQ